MISFITGGSEDKPKSAVDKFCEVCKAAGRNKDCDSCSREVTVVDLKG